MLQVHFCNLFHSNLLVYLKVQFSEGFIFLIETKKPNALGASRPAFGGKECDGQATPM